MQTSIYKQSYSFFNLFEKFINDNKKGKRLQPNGKKISAGTAANYYYTFLLLQRFSTEKQFELRIRALRRLNTRDLTTERNYWKKFYKRFSDFLYHDCGCFDNYAGSVFKNIRVFFNYLNKELAFGVGDFHKSFYVRKDEIAIFPLLPEELNFLIYDKGFEEGLTARMKEVKDFFVFQNDYTLISIDLYKLPSKIIEPLSKIMALFFRYSLVK